MKRLVNSLLLIVLTLTAGVVAANAQKAPADYKITNVKIVPYESSTGEFGAEIKKGDDTSFFNDLGVSLFVVVEISGEPGAYANRNLRLTVTEGRKVKASDTSMIGILNENGKYYLPLWLNRAMCDQIKITAAITGQKTTSTTVRTVAFQCGE